MMTDYERVIKQFIPAFRLKAAHMMIEQYGIKQQQAATMLGTTQAAISKYLKENVDKYQNVNINKNEIAAFIEQMKVDKTEEAQRIMCKACQTNKKFDCAFIVK